MADTKVSDLPALNGVDVDPADLLYIVDSSAGAAGSKKITVGQYQVAPYSAGTANGVMYFNASNVVTTGSGLVFDGSNLLVGTASNTNSRRLLVNGTGSGITYVAVGDISQTASQTLLGIDPASTIGYVGNTTWGLGFLTNGVEKMRLDASGNLGLGVTPSASWSSSWTAIQIGVSAAMWAFKSVNGLSGSYFSNNSVFDGTNRVYINTAAATEYAQVTGQHIWYTAPSGTAGNAITFTQAMTLDASGNLDLGTTGGSDRYQNVIATSAKLTFNAGTGFTGSAATSIYNQSAIALVFGTNNTERARITSGGNLLVGKTADDQTTVGTRVEAVGAITLVRNSATNCVQINKKGNAGDLLAFYYNDAAVVGTITNSSTNTAYNTTSDRRLKENIAPAPSASDVIDAIEIVSHDWKAAPDEHVKYGVIAQDLHAVAPQAVSPGDDGTEIERTWGVDYSKLVPMLIKEIQSLRARVAALEAQ